MQGVANSLKDCHTDLMRQPDLYPIVVLTCLINILSCVFSKKSLKYSVPWLQRKYLWVPTHRPNISQEPGHSHIVCLKLDCVWVAPEIICLKMPIDLGYISPILASWSFAAFSFVKHHLTNPSQKTIDPAIGVGWVIPYLTGINMHI